MDQKVKKPGNSFSFFGPRGPTCTSQKSHWVVLRVFFTSQRRLLPVFDYGRFNSGKKRWGDFRTPPKTADPPLQIEGILCLELLSPSQKTKPLCRPRTPTGDQRALPPRDNAQQDTHPEWFL
jgi:hypothetical protein